MWQRVAILGLGLVMLAGCQRPGTLPTTRTNVAVRTAGVPVPADNPMTQAKVELGFRLWFEPRLSANNRMTCGTCHHHMKGFSNDEPNAAGVTGTRGNRNVPTIYAAAYSSHQFWDGRAKTLEEQALGPIENPIEMGTTLPEVVRKLEAHPYYPQKFREAFGTGVTADGIAKAIATFERALTVGPSPYDRYLAGDQGALTAQQIRGEQVFKDRGRCTECHTGPNLTDGAFHNLGVGFDGPAPDLGRFAVTKDPADTGRFKTPTLRNVAQTGPYMHDGSLATLQDVVDFYNRGGNENDHLDQKLKPIHLMPEEQEDLIAFLEALTGKDNLKELGKLPGIHNPRIKEQTSIPRDLLP